MVSTLGRVARDREEHRERRVGSRGSGDAVEVDGGGAHLSVNAPDDFVAADVDFLIMRGARDASLQQDLFAWQCDTVVRCLVVAFALTTSLWNKATEYERCFHHQRTAWNLEFGIFLRAISGFVLCVCILYCSNKAARTRVFKIR